MGKFPTFTNTQGRLKCLSPPIQCITVKAWTPGVLIYNIFANVCEAYQRAIIKC